MTDRKSYIELLKDPRWQKIRLEVFEREGFTCQYCESTDKTLHIHHTYYDFSLKPWEYPINSLECLCEDCHEEEKKKKEHIKWVAEELKKVDMETIEFIVGYLHGSKTLHPDDEINKDTKIELTLDIILGICSHFSYNPQKEINFRDFLVGFLDEKLIAYKEIMDYVTWVRQEERKERR